MDRPFPTWVLLVGTAAAVGTVLVVLVIGLLRRGRRVMLRNLDRVSATDARTGAAGRAAKPVAFIPPPTTLAADPSPVDHRVSYRRPGNPVLVLVTGADEPDQMFQAWVVDRSRRG